MSHLGCVHYEGRLLHVLTNSKEGKEPDTTLQRSLPVHETAKGIVNIIVIFMMRMMVTILTIIMMMMSLHVHEIAKSIIVIIIIFFIMMILMIMIS